MKQISFILIVFFLASLSAQPVVNFYIDESGDTDILGNSESKISLPEGIFFEDNKIFGSTQTLTSKNGEIWAFNFLTDTKSNLVVYLPKGASLENVPEDAEVYINKNQIVVDCFSDSVYFEYELNKSPTNLWTYVMIIFVLALLVLVYLKLKNKLKKQNKILSKPVDKLKIIKDTLNDREKLILAKLKFYKNNKIKIKQNQLRKVLKIPKASFSRHLRELERKKIIVRIGDGKNKFVELK